MDLFDFPDNLYLSNYGITTNGSIYFKEFDRLEPQFVRNGKPYVTLINDHYQSRNENIDLLMAFTFLPEPPSGSILIHLDGNNYNNDINNLQWMVIDEKNSRKRKKVNQFTINGEFIRNWNSLEEINISFCRSKKSSLVS